VSIVCGFLMVLATFALLVLGSEAGSLVGKCALAAALMSSTVSLALFVARRIVLPRLGFEIVPAAKGSALRPRDAALVDAGASGLAATLLQPRSLATLTASPGASVTEPPVPFPEEEMALLLGPSAASAVARARSSVDTAAVLRDAPAALSPAVAPPTAATPAAAADDFYAELERSVALIAAERSGDVDDGGAALEVGAADDDIVLGDVWANLERS
jgi:hypothetical protein